MPTTLGNISAVTQVQWPKVFCASNSVSSGCAYQIIMNRPGNTGYSQPAATTLVLGPKSAGKDNPKPLTDIVLSQEQQTTQGATALDAVQIQMLDSFSYYGTINGVPITEDFSAIPDTFLGQWLNVKGTAYLPQPYYVWINWFDKNGNLDICFVGLYDALQKVQPYQKIFAGAETNHEVLKGIRNMQVVSAGQLPSMTLWKDVLALIDHNDCAQGDFYSGWMIPQDKGLWGYLEQKSGVYSDCGLTVQQAVPYYRVSGNNQSGDPGVYGHGAMSLNRYGEPARSNSDPNKPWPSQRGQANWQVFPLRAGTDPTLGGSGGAQVAFGGTNWTVGDTFTINGFTITPCVCTVTGVSGGAVTTFTTTSGGAGYAGYLAVDIGGFIPPVGTTPISTSNPSATALTVDIVYVVPYNWGPWGTWGIRILTLIQKCCTAMGYSPFNDSDLVSALDRFMQVTSKTNFCFPVHPVAIPVDSQWVSLNLLAGAHPWDGSQSISPASMDPNAPIASLLQGIWDFLLVDAQTVVDQSNGQPKYRLVPLGTLNGSISSTSIYMAGTGYQVGDTGGISDATSTISGNYTITSVGAGGVVTDYVVGFGGAGFTVGYGSCIADEPQPGAGSGFMLNILSINSNGRPAKWQVGKNLSEEPPSIGTVSVSVSNLGDSMVKVAPMLQPISQARGSSLSRVIPFRMRRIGVAVSAGSQEYMLDYDSLTTYDQGAGQAMSCFDCCDLGWNNATITPNGDWWKCLTGVYLYTQDSDVMDNVYDASYWGAFNSATQGGHSVASTSPNGDGYGSGSYTTGAFMTLGAQYARGERSGALSGDTFHNLSFSAGLTSYAGGGYIMKSALEPNYDRFNTISYQSVVLADYLIPKPTAVKRNYIGTQADDGTISSLGRGFFNSWWYDGEVRTFRDVQMERHLRAALTPTVRYVEVLNSGAFPDITAIPFGNQTGGGGSGGTVTTSNGGNGGSGNGGGGGQQSAAATGVISYQELLTPWTTNTPNWAVTLTTPITKLYISTSITTGVNLSGIVASPAMNEAIILVLINNGSYYINLTHEDTASTAANRFHFIDGKTELLGPGGEATFHYDTTLARWRRMSIGG
jgi:hypothetical protein